MMVYVDETLCLLLLLLMLMLNVFRECWRHLVKRDEEGGTLRLLRGQRGRSPTGREEFRSGDAIGPFLRDGR